MKRWKTILAGTLAAVMLVPAAVAAPNHSTLSDLKGHWAKDEIQQAINDGWVDGYPDGTFKPEKTITRAEFTKMLLDATHLTEDNETVQWMKEATYLKPEERTLYDMSSHWLTKQGWMETALYSGMVVAEDYNGHNFRPEKDIARYEIALMTDRALGLVYPATQPVTEELPFTDNADILDWMKGYVNESVKAGVLKGYPNGRFGPNKTATRAEAVVMVQRTLDYMEEGIDHEITVIAQYSGFDETAQKELTRLPAQFIDGTLYVSGRDIFLAWHELRHELYGNLCPAPKLKDVHWYPIDQTIDTQFDLYWVFQAGNTAMGQDYDGPWHGTSDRHMVAPAHMLYGEVMIPVYGSHDDSTAHFFHWEDGWDAASKIMTIKLPEPWYLSP